MTLFTSTKHRFFVAMALLLAVPGLAQPVAREVPIARVTVTESAGLQQPVAYVDFAWQMPREFFQENRRLVALSDNGQQRIYVQLYDVKNSAPDSALGSFRGLFPVALTAGESRTFTIASVDSAAIAIPNTDLKRSGGDLVGQVENQFFQAALSQKFTDDQTGNQSGQMRELRIKMGQDHLLTNVEDHLHWAPNFHRPELDYYRTIAAWDPPPRHRIEAGPYLVQSVRQGPAPFHPEIHLSAVYRFLAGVPYFLFYSEMTFVEDLAVDLLRNDEMTMDSMFTDLGFERPGGAVVAVPLSGRHELLERQPIENEAPWLCFYNRDHGFAFGSIRLLYDNTNRTGNPSPVFAPFTQIGEWLHGITYWNRRLIHDQLVSVPAGSRYREKNAYLVFQAEEGDPFRQIRDWAARLGRQVVVTVTEP